jgi:large subunit ribosomal protein L13
MDTGDNVVAINASRVKISGNKQIDKKYFRYTGYPGGLRIKSYGKMMEHDSDLVFQHAVKGMLPKNKLGRKIIKKLHIYADDKHPHQAQNPETLNLSKSK